MADRSWEGEIVPENKICFPGSLIRIQTECFDPLAFLQHLNCNERRREQVRWRMSWGGRGCSGRPFYLFQTLSVSHYSRRSLRDLTHWNPVKALRQQHRQTERGESREREEERAIDKTEVRQNTRPALSPIFPEYVCRWLLSKPPLASMNNEKEQWVC